MYCTVAFAHINEYTLSYLCLSVFVKFVTAVRASYLSHLGMSVSVKGGKKESHADGSFIAIVSIRDEGARVEDSGAKYDEGAMRVDLFQCNLIPLIYLYTVKKD
jgi:hypothetical protein